MPMYERRCLGCHHKLLVLRKLKDREDPMACPDCGGATKFIMSAPQTNFTFADPSPFKGPKNFGTGRRAKYIQDEHSLIEE